MDQEIKKYTTSGNRVIYRLPVMAFPKHITNTYLVLDDEITLIDPGSGIDLSNESLKKCFESLRDDHGEKVTLGDVGRVIITHGHIDHFGGLNYVQRNSKARIGIHELDLSTVRNFKERLIVSSRNLEVFLDRAGLELDKVTYYVDRNKWSKNVFQATPVDFTFDDGEIIGSGYRIFHTPGHCPGQVCLGFDDILFTADHILERITPNQSPESIIRYNGLGHYYESLRKMKKVEGFRLGLGGHEGEIIDIEQRIDAIIEFHDERLEKTLALCGEPQSIKQIAEALFPYAKDYHVLLALTEAGAHVEYLHERGQIVVTNIDEVESEPNPTLYYVKA